MAIDRAQVMTWLEAANIEFETCDECHGLHITSMQAHEAVIESRLFVEPEWLMFVTEVELLPSALLKAVSHMAEFNLRLPTLKTFVDVVDDALPKMVLTHSIFTVNSISPDQFVTFVKATQDAMSYAIQFAEQYELLLVDGESEDVEVASVETPPVGGIH